VLCWYGAYFRPGRLTGGLDVWVTSRKVAHDERSMEATLVRDADAAAAGKVASILVTLQDGETYGATWNGAPVPARPVVPGCVAVRLPADAAEGVLRVLAEPSEPSRRKAGRGI